MNGRHEREKVKKGRFRFVQAILEGIIVRDGPVTRYAQNGQQWTEATVLVDLYDSRQKAERERPAFVRLKAFDDLSNTLSQYEYKSRIHVAGHLLIEVWETRDGELRESYELLADAISNERFGTLAELFGNTPHREAAPPAESAGAGPDPIDDDRDIPF